jgi:phytoene dehydrogenase-like protein
LKPPDVIVVGAGHNGLVAACSLAKSGLDVLVVEQREIIGGCTTSERLVPEAPDHLLGPCAADIITMRGSTIVSDLGLASFGYREADIDPAYLALGPEGDSLGFFRDVRRTAEDIRRFSHRDADTFLDLMRAFDHVVDAAVPMMATNPTRPDGRALLAAARAAVKHPKSVGIVASLASSTAAEAIEAHFEHPIVQAGIAQIANYGSPITGEGTGPNIMLLGLIARFGMGRPIGGMGSLPAALERCLSFHGGRVRTSAPVDQAIASGGQIVGVRLADGEEIPARAVLVSAEPWRALNRILPSGLLSDKHAARAAHIPQTNDGCSHFKVEMALSGRVELSRHAARRTDGLDPRVPSHCVGTLGDICNAIRSAQLGHVPEVIPFTSALTTGADPSVAPPGQDGLTLWTGWMPWDPPQGWPALRSEVEQAFVSHAAEYYDGIEQLEIGRWVADPTEINEAKSLRFGNVYQVDLAPTRMGPLRPALGFGGYKTPVPGYFITGGGTHPGPSVSGIPGQQAARVVARALAKDDRLRHPPGYGFAAQVSPVEETDVSGNGRASGALTR